MGLFKRKINKNAANQPRIVKDYFHLQLVLLGWMLTHLQQ